MIDKSKPERLGRIDIPRKQRDLQRAPISHQARQRPGAAAVGGSSNADLGEIDNRILGGDHEIEAERDR